MKPKIMSSRLDEIVQDFVDPFHCSSYLLQDTYHQRHDIKPSTSSVAWALTRARNVVRDARPETDDWIWTGRLYQHRRDPEVTLKQSGNWWVMYLGGRASASKWRASVDWRSSSCLKQDDPMENSLAPPMDRHHDSLPIRHLP